MRTTSLAVLLSTFSAFLPSQAPGHLVGMTRNLPALRHHDPATCTNLAQCVLPGMPPATPLPPFVGGTAWDPVRSGAWVCNGLLLGKYDDNCVVQCAPAAIPTLGAAAFITGMEVVEGMNQLWMIDSQGFLHFYTDACPPMPLGVCNTGLAPTAVGQVTTALAVDELRGIVFIAYPNFPVGPNRIVVSTLANPCVPISQFQIPPCFAAFGAILGLACDWGTQTLYATDGINTVTVPYAWLPPNVIPGLPSCCPAIAVADPMIGLAVRPGRATSVGMPCANGPCPPCPMLHTLANDPSLGNAQFRLALAQAPANSFAWCLIGMGPCAPPGVVVPPLCGPVYTIPYLGALGGNPTGGGFAICDGSTTFNLPLPIVPGLAGQVFSSQCLGLCFGGGVFGFSLSNCLSWQVQGS
ncbi:MAG TPA: hypothetical protein VFZ65_23520 [Planctomycetota bacterium]|nr:hypothetical protein [Planctomycetota bacterium]